MFSELLIRAVDVCNLWTLHGPRRIQMLEETLVAFCPPLGAPLPNEDRAPLPRFASLQHSSSMADLLDRVVRALLRSPSTIQVREVAVAMLHTSDR